MDSPPFSLMIFPYFPFTVSIFRSGIVHLQPRCFPIPAEVEQCLKQRLGAAEFPSKLRENAMQNALFIDICRFFWAFKHGDLDCLFTLVDNRGANSHG